MEEEETDHTCNASAMEPSRMPKKMMPRIMQAMAICVRRTGSAHACALPFGCGCLISVITTHGSHESIMDPPLGTGCKRQSQISLTSLRVRPF